MTQEEFMSLCELLDERYVKQKDCDTRQEKVNKKFANDDKRIDLLVSKMQTWNKLLWVIATSGIGGLVTAVLNLILK